MTSAGENQVNSKPDALAVAEPSGAEQKDSPADNNNLKQTTDNKTNEKEKEVKTGDEKVNGAQGDTKEKNGEAEKKENNGEAQKKEENNMEVDDNKEQKQADDESSAPEKSTDEKASEKPSSTSQQQKEQDTSANKTEEKKRPRKRAAEDDDAESEEKTVTKKEEEENKDTAEEPKEEESKDEKRPGRGRKKAAETVQATPSKKARRNTAQDKQEQAASEEDEQDQEPEEDDGKMEIDETEQPKKRGRGRPPTKAAAGTPLKKTATAAAASAPGTPKTPGRRGRGAARELTPHPELEIPAIGGKALSSGDGETGQLGIGPDGEEGKPRFVAVQSLPTGDAVRCAAGAMHSLLLTNEGKVYSFGCNDDGSLGRVTGEEEECFSPGLVEIPEGLKVAKIAVGNVHSVALATTCRVFIWGSYRDNNGPFGIQPDNEGVLRQPTDITQNIGERIVDIAAAGDHTIMLSDKGNIFTMGCAEQGRLGRIKSSHCCRENRRARQTMLTPMKVVAMKGRKAETFDRIWTGRFNTFARSATDGRIWGCGLNNYLQMGKLDTKLLQDLCAFQLVPLPAFDIPEDRGDGVKWECISGGDQHTMALDSKGHIYVMGRVLYGRLGLGQERARDNDADVTELTRVAGPVADKVFKAIACGDHTSFALDSEGRLYSWGQGTNMLGQGDRDAADNQDVFEPTPCTSKNLRDAQVTYIAAGSNHAMCIVRPAAGGSA